jgi:hypothetical protein
MIRLHLLNPGVGDALSDTIARALELRPERRFGSAAEMQKTLRHRQSEKIEPGPVAATEDARRVDAAMPAEVEVGRQTDLIVQVRFANSPVLGLEDWPTRRKPSEIEQGTEPIRLVYPIDALTGRLMPARVRIKVVTPDFVLSGSSEHLLAVPHDEYSKRLGFLLTPQRSGTCRVNVEVSGPDGIFLGSIAMETIAVGDGAHAAEWRIGNLVLEALRRPLGEIGNNVLLAAHYELATRAREPRHADPAALPKPPDSVWSIPQGYDPATPRSPVPDTTGPPDLLGQMPQLSSRAHGELREDGAGHHAPVESMRSKVGRRPVLASTIVAILASIIVAWRFIVPTSEVSAPTSPPRAEQPLAGGPPAPLPPTDTTSRSVAPTVPNPGPSAIDLKPHLRETLSRPDAISIGLPPPSKSGKWLVQVLATPDNTVASYYVKKLAAGGLPAFLTSPSAEDAARVYKVQVGRYENQNDAEKVARRIEAYESLRCRVLQGNRE